MKQRNILAGNLVSWPLQIGYFFSAVIAMLENVSLKEELFDSYFSQFLTRVLQMLADVKKTEAVEQGLGTLEDISFRLQGHISSHLGEIVQVLLNGIKVW